MRRLLKRLAVIVAVLVVLVAITLFALTQFIDPNDYKPQIEKLAHDEANLSLNIKGSLGWTLWPSLGVSIGQTEARIGASEKLFASIQQADASVAVWPLLFGSVQVDGLTLSGLTLHLVKTSSGGNWEQIGNHQKTAQIAARQPATDTVKTPSQQATADKAPLEIPVVIPQVNINDATITYDDDTSATHLTVSHLNLAAQHVNLEDDTPFPLALSLRYQDAVNRLDMTLKAQTSLDLAHNHYRLTPMMLDTTISGSTPKPVSVHLQQTVDANLDTGIVSLADMVLDVAGVKGTGQVRISGIDNGKLVFDGKVDIAPFNANTVLKTLGETPVATSHPDALSKVAASLTLKGPVNSVMINPLVVTLDNSTLKGKAGLADINTGKILFDLALDKITLDGYLPPVKEKSDNDGQTGSVGAATGGTQQVSDTAEQSFSTAPLLPLETLRSLNVDGHLVIGALHYAGINGENLQASITAQGGKLAVKTNGRLMAGNFVVTSLLDASGTPAVSTEGKVENMQIQPAAQLALGKDLMKGILGATFSGTAQGNSEQSLMNSAAGKLDLELKDGTVRGANLHNALVAGINDLLGKYQGLAALLPKAQKLPKVLSQDTRIVDLTAAGALKHQLVTFDQVKAQLEKGNLNGHGWFNLNNKDFEFNLGMQSPEFSDSPYLKDTNWPVRCAGNLEGNPKRWCGPDRHGLDDIAKQAMKKAAVNKMAEKLGIKTEGGSTDKGIQNTAKDKAKEALKKKLDSLFK
jgi:AsmA protein